MGASSRHLDAAIDASLVSFSHFFLEPVGDSPIVHLPSDSRPLVFLSSFATLPPYENCGFAGRFPAHTGQFTTFALLLPATPEFPEAINPKRSIACLGLFQGHEAPRCQVDDNDAAAAPATALAPSHLALLFTWLAAS